LFNDKKGKKTDVVLNDVELIKKPASNQSHICNERAFILGMGVFHRFEKNGLRKGCSKT
jgi:hypothetical protein